MNVRILLIGQYKTSHLVERVRGLGKWSGKLRGSDFTFDSNQPLLCKRWGELVHLPAGDSQSPEQRDAVCDVLEAWAALVDAHGFPMSASITYGSAIAGPDARFEDPATACLGAEGIAANPNCFGLLIHFANHLHAQAGLEQMTLECTG